MPKLANPQLIDACNNDLRVCADRLLQLDSRAVSAIATYNARNLGTIIDQGGAGELIADGSATDGRTRCTGGDVYNFVTLLQDFETWMTQGRRDVLAKWQVNGNR